MDKRRRNTLVSGIIPLVSKITPCASQIPPITICRFWGIAPSWRWGESVVPATRRREVRPIDVGLRGIFTWPKIVAETVLKQIGKQAEHERDVESELEKELLQLKMRCESSEISEKEYKKKEAELRKRLEALQKR